MEIETLLTTIRILMKNKRLIIICFAIFLAGCTTASRVTTTGSFKSLSNSDPEKGTIYVYRESSFAGIANQYDVMINGNLAGSLPNGSFFSIDAAVGENKVEPKTLTANNFGKGANITIKKGQVQCLKLTLNFCVSCKSADIDIVETKQCMSEIKSLLEVQLRSKKSN